MSTYYRPTKPIPLDAIKKNKYLKDIGFDVIDTKDKQYFFRFELWKLSIQY